MMNNQNVSRLPLAAFVLTILIGGFNAISVHYTVLELPPFWSATLRLAPASLVLFLLTFILKLPLPKGRALVGAIIFGVLGFGVSYGLMYFGLRKVQPGMAQVILALAPLFTIIFAFFHRQERIRLRALLGALVAAAGIGLIFRQQLHSSVPVLYFAAVIVGAACIAESGVIAKSFPRNNPVTTNAVGTAVGAVILFAASAATREARVLPVQTTTWLALLFLIFFGTSAFFVLFLYVLKYWPVSTASYQFVLLPLVALSASALITHESLSPVILTGGALVLAGVFVGVLAPSIHWKSKRNHVIQIADRDSSGSLTSRSIPEPVIVENEPCPGQD